MPTATTEELRLQTLAQLHAIAKEHDIQGFRKLRKEELVETLAKAGVSAPPPPKKKSESKPTGESKPGRGPTRPERSASTEAKIAHGTIKIQSSGSALLMPEGAEDQKGIYVSQAQVKRCALKEGDTVSGPTRAPRRSERYAALIRIETINGRSASEIEAPVRSSRSRGKNYPDTLFTLKSADDVVNTIFKFAPFGKGSRVTIVGGAHAGKTSLLRSLLAAIDGGDDVNNIQLVLAGVRAEDVTDYHAGAIKPKAAHDIVSDPVDRVCACNSAIDEAKKICRRGQDALVAIDTLTGLPEQDRCRLMANAQNYAGGGSLTIIATADVSVGGETTIIGLDPVLCGLRRLPPLDFDQTSTLRPELLVGEKGVDEMVKARASALLE